MRDYARLSGLLLVLVLSLAGCGSGGNGGNGDSHRFDYQIQDAYQQLANVVVNENTNALSQLLSPVFLDSGTDYNGFLSQYQSYFDTYSNIQMTFNLQTITFDDPNLPYYADVLFYFTLTGINGAGNRVDLVANSRDQLYKMTWRYEDSRWKMFGNQLSSPAAASALRKGASPALIGDPQAKTP